MHSQIAGITEVEPIPGFIDLDLRLFYISHQPKFMVLGGLVQACVRSKS